MYLFGLLSSLFLKSVTPWFCNFSFILSGIKKDISLLLTTSIAVFRILCGCPLFWSSKNWSSLGKGQHYFFSTSTNGIPFFNLTF